MFVFATVSPNSALAEMGYDLGGDVAVKYGFSFAKPFNMTIFIKRLVLDGFPGGKRKVEEPEGEWWDEEDVPNPPLPEEELDDLTEKERKLYKGLPDTYDDEDYLCNATEDVASAFQCFADRVLGPEHGLELWEPQDEDYQGDELYMFGKTVQDKNSCYFPGAGIGGVPFGISACRIPTNDNMDAIKEKMKRIASRMEERYEEPKWLFVTSCRGG